MPNAAAIAEGETRKELAMLVRGKVRTLQISGTSTRRRENLRFRCSRARNDRWQAVHFSFDWCGSGPIQMTISFDANLGLAGS
jgi:hypothetical protein